MIQLVWAIVATAAAVAVGLALGLLFGWLWQRLRSARPATAVVAPMPARVAPPAPPAPRAAPVPVETASRADPDGDLVAGLIAIHDLSGGSEIVRSRVEQVLARAGIAILAPPSGTAFDPTIHHAVDAQPAAPGASPDTVARVVRPGWGRGTDMIRAAEVVVWT